MRLVRLGSGAMRKHDSKGQRRSGSASPPKQQRLIEIAEQTLKFFEDTANNAHAQLAAAQPNSMNVLAPTNTWTNQSAVRALGAIYEEQRRNLFQLCREPAIARIVAVDDDGKQKTYFISRATPQGFAAGLPVASYRSPLGRLGVVAHRCRGNDARWHLP